MRRFFKILKWLALIAGLYYALNGNNLIGLYYGLIGSMFLMGDIMLDILKQNPNKKTLELLRNLADLQNDAPLESEREEWEKTMEKVYRHLKKHEL